MQNFQNQSLDPPPKKVPPKINIHLFWIFLAIVLLVGFTLGSIIRIYREESRQPSPEPSPAEPRLEKESEGVFLFKDEAEFRTYLQEVADLEEYDSAWASLPLLERGEREMLEAPGDALTEVQEEPLPDRISETNVQVVGIDEPDLVKTDGSEIYFSRVYEDWYGPEPFLREEEIMLLPPRRESGTDIIHAFPPEDLERRAEIEEQGELLLVNDMLIIFAGSDIFGYDIADPASPEEKWSIQLEGSTIVTSRLYQDKIYLVVQEWIDQYNPCPVRPLIHQGDALEIACTEIYHPSEPVPIDLVLIAMVIDPHSGTVEDKISFLGSSGTSVVYMSSEALYITYSFTESMVGFYLDFYQSAARDLIPDSVLDKLERLESYELSNSAKMVEYEQIMNRFLFSLGDDESLRVENELENRLSDYYQEHKRDLEKSGIVKIKLQGGFELVDTGEIPGAPLNQFALDEYEGNLRVATTIGDRSIVAGGESANDVYVLDQKMRVIGSVQDLGLTESIYSVRFIQDQGYVVTFRQIDPFYVLDLSNPREPELMGELKIPGFSSYLHPISRNKILGVGEEDWQVKISLFDVSDPNNPQEVDNYVLDEGWTEVNENHHAFLLDRKHDVFFLPGGRGGYIFSYKEDKLSMVKAVRLSNVKRALYLDDYLYILSVEKIIVMNETDWATIEELNL